MKVLTIRDPWASLVIEGYKKYAEPIVCKGQLGLWNYERK